MLVFRYIFCVGYGCVLAIPYKKLNKGYYILAFVVGTSFLMAVSYLGYVPKIITYWSGTSFLATLYIIPIFGFLYYKCQNMKYGMFEIIGKASFNIFLVQKLYYKYVDEIIADYILNRGLHLLVNILVCVGIGIVFYYMMIPIYTRLLQKERSIILIDTIIKK